MMFERFTQDARAIVQASQEHARRLGHRYIGGEHILLAVVSTSQPASAVMRAHGVTPELVEEEIVRRVGLGAGAGLFGGLDRDALATIGIDLDAVRARIEASFGQQALSNAAQAAYPARRRHPAAPDRAQLAPHAPGPAGHGHGARTRSPASRGHRPLLRSRTAA